MTTEEDFQKALDTNPEDNQTRLVFADWLQERNDPRAEGYRELGRLGKRPAREIFIRDQSKQPFYIFAKKWGGGGGGLDNWCILPVWWMDLLELMPDYLNANGLTVFSSRQEAENASAQAYRKMMKIISTPIYAIESREVRKARDGLYIEAIYDSTVTKFQIVRTAKDHLRWKPLERGCSLKRPLKLTYESLLSMSNACPNFLALFDKKSKEVRNEIVSHYSVTKRQLCMLDAIVTDSNP